MCMGSAKPTSDYRLITFLDAQDPLRNAGIAPIAEFVKYFIKIVSRRFKSSVCELVTILRRQCAWCFVLSNRYLIFNLTPPFIDPF